MLVDNLREHRVSTSTPIEVEGDDDDNDVVRVVEHVPISINGDEEPAAAEASPPPW